jgi:YfiH family protein
VARADASGFRRVAGRDPVTALHPQWLRPEWGAPSRVRAVVTTRAGGVSHGPYASLNLSERVGDDPFAVERNRNILRAALPGDPVWLMQVHGTDVVDAAAVSSVPRADAAYTRAHRIVCAVQVADCLPVLLADRAGTVVAVAHAGWRGLAAGVIERTVAAMGAGPLTAWLGPAIGQDAFEVGEEVRAAFVAADASAAGAFRSGAPGKWHADLYALARLRLASVGVTDVAGGGLCTWSDPGRFFSYRRSSVTGRMAALVWLD